MRTRTYLGTDFEVWKNGDSWFWFVPDPLRARGAIGAAAGELDAVREACATIDEMRVERGSGRQPGSASIGAAGIDWAAMLASLERYLSRLWPATA
jgi:hypothetical protein